MLHSHSLRARLALPAAVLAGALALTADRADAAVVPGIENRTLTVTGDAAANQLTLRFPPSAPTTLELDVGDDGSADFRFQRSEFDRIRVLAGDGDDRVRVVDGGLRVPVTTPLTVEGQGGADSVSGGRGADELRGGDGNDDLDGRGGTDAADGGAGFDRLGFSGTETADQLRIAADGTTARLTRDGAGVDLAGVERVDVAALGGDDALTVDDLAGTGVQEVRPDLAATAGGSAPDAGSDRLLLRGTGTADFVNILGGGGQTSVLGLPAFVQIQRADATRDHLTLEGQAGSDNLNAGSIALPFKLTADGGAGNDMVFGGPGTDLILGGDGNDFVDSQKGNDNVLLGAGDDTFTFETADGGDTVEGATGTDQARLSASSANETLRFERDGDRARLERNGGPNAEDVADTSDIERLDVLSFGGADKVLVGDLSGTAVTNLGANLFDFGVPGGNVDSVIVDGTDGDDDITATAAAGGAAVDVTGLSAALNITGAVAAGDNLEIHGLGGEDRIEAFDLPTSELRLFLFGGAADDLLLGSEGSDVILGRDGDDLALGGGGEDVAVGDAGDDVLHGDDGDDVLDGSSGFDRLVGGADDDVLLNGESNKQD